VQGDLVEILYQEFLKLSEIDNYPIDNTKIHMYRVEGLSVEKACTLIIYLRSVSLCYVMMKRDLSRVFQCCSIQITCILRM
jgi:hypothetical protein